MSDAREASPTGDPLIAEAESAEAESQRAARAANLFDLRRLIGALFAVYGVILVILGLGASDAELDKAAGWNLNLGTGIAMLALAALFLIWAFSRPLSDELEKSEPPEGDRTAGGAPDAAESRGSESTRGAPRSDRR
jgi:hypothetical protein